MAVSTNHAVAYTIASIFKHIIDCVQLYFTNGFTNIVLSSLNCLWLVGVTLIFDGTLQIIVQRCQIKASSWPNDISSATLAKKIIFSDETHFNLGGYVNKQNCCIWGTENPHAYIEKPTYPKRVTAWWGFSSRGIIEPFFFENEQGEAVTVSGDRYWAMLNEFLFTKI